MSDHPEKPANRISAFFGLPRSDQLLLCQALVLIPTVSLGLKVFGFRRVYRLLDRWAPIPDESSPVNPDRVHRIADLVGKAAWRGLYPVTCLPRSMSLWAVLRRNLFGANLCIGVRRSEAGIQGHAWVEVNQVPLLERVEIKQEFIQIPLTSLKPGIKLD